MSTVFLVLVKQAERAGELGPHVVHRAVELDYLPITDAGFEDKASEATAEARYLQLLRSGIEASDFIFSYSYALHLRMQHNMAPRGRADPSQTPPRDALLFVWNSFMLRQLDGGGCGGADGLLRSGFGVALVCGTFHQRRVSLLGRPICLTLLSRRSAEFAGTRFRKRGVNSEGNVANEVETEQIVAVESTLLHPLGMRHTAFVQIRGSIPLQWSQRPGQQNIAEKITPKVTLGVHQAPLACASSRSGPVLSHLLPLRCRPRRPELRRDQAALRRPRAAVRRSDDLLQPRAADRAGGGRRGPREGAADRRCVCGGRPRDQPAEAGRQGRDSARGPRSARAGEPRVGAESHRRARRAG